MCTFSTHLFHADKQYNSPMKALGIVIFSQFRSRISSPESGFCISRMITDMGVVEVNLSRNGTSSTVPTTYENG